MFVSLTGCELYRRTSRSLVFEGGSPRTTYLVLVETQPGGCVFFALNCVFGCASTECDQWQQKTVPKYRFFYSATTLLIEVPELPGLNKKEESIMWTKPSFNDLRIGFEVTMYIANR